MSNGGRGSGGGGGNSRGGGGGGNSRRARPAKGRSGGTSNRGARAGDAEFWGRPPEAPPAVTRVRATTDPAALPRSLGDPPLGPNPAAAAHHLAVIYEEAVRAGTALAAASGLLEDEGAPTGTTPD